MKSIKSPLKRLSGLLNIHKRYYLFVCLSTLFIALMFTSTDFLTIPVNSFKDVCILFMQWIVVTLSLFFAMLILSVNRYIFLFLMPLLTLVSAVLAYFRYTINATLTPMLLDAALDNDLGTSAQLVSGGLILFLLAALLLSAGLVYLRFKLGFIQYKPGILLTAYRSGRHVFLYKRKRLSKTYIRTYTIQYLLYRKQIQRRKTKHKATTDQLNRAK